MHLPWLAQPGIAPKLGHRPMAASTFREFPLGGSTLRAQVLRGGSWLGAGTVGGQALKGSVQPNKGSYKLIA